MKLYVKIMLLLFAGGFPFITHSQTDSTALELAKERNKTTGHMLDYRFRGGTGEFERLLLQHVSYTPEALTHCVTGTVILSFTVDCDNKMSEMRMRNPMYYGLNEQLQAFYKATEGMWNTCTDTRYTRFEIPILFSIENLETQASGLIEVEGQGPGLRCKGDSYYIEQYKKYQEKGKVKKALEMLDVLIHRDPYNLQYYDLKKNLLGTGENP